MTADTAYIPMALNEVLLPSERSDLMAVAIQEHRQPGEVFVIALREYLERRRATQPTPEAQSATAALVA